MENGAHLFGDEMNTKLLKNLGIMIVELEEALFQSALYMDSEFESCIKTIEKD